MRTCVLSSSPCALGFHGFCAHVRTAGRRCKRTCVAPTTQSQRLPPPDNTHVRPHRQHTRRIRQNTHVGQHRQHTHSASTTCWSPNYRVTDAKARPNQRSCAAYCNPNCLGVHRTPTRRLRKHVGATHPTRPVPQTLSHREACSLLFTNSCRYTCGAFRLLQVRIAQETPNTKECPQKYCAIAVPAQTAACKVL